MERRLFKFAGIEIEVSMPGERFYKDEYRLAPFRTDFCQEPHTIKFSWVEEFSEPVGKLVSKEGLKFIYSEKNEQIRFLNVREGEWKRADLRVVHKGKVHEVEVRKAAFPGRIGLKTVLECMSVEHLILEENAFLLHCSYIRVRGKAILFTAPSETGKSTQAELWKTLRGADIVNGDRGAIRLKEGKILAEGVPFAGSSEYCKNESLPIEAIVYLEQASNTSIRRLQGHEAFSSIWKGCSVNTWNRNDVEKLVSLVMQAAVRVPVFHLACTPDESAVIALEKAIMESEGAR